ncbi:hypothetical protein ZOSMA_63G00490 [Zostera marina]|uniref:Uncharacterized protein n=1 Tax=Zostera marina TaxID=29655 RepID=A0A0K9NT07_ZOSMR|nr:hypothetical protein ZOSMA_63G00490 [Zostera marina]
MTEQGHKSKDLSGTGSSSSTSNDGTASDSKSIVEEIRSEESEPEESARRRMLKGKEVMINESKKKTIPLYSPTRMKIVLDRREKHKAEVEAKYEQIFGKPASPKKSMNPKKKKSPKESVKLRRSSRLSAASGTSSGLSPDSEQQETTCG